VLKDTPAWAFQAADDPVVLPQSSIDTVNSINACNPPERAKITLFPTGGHLDEYLVMNLTALGQGVAPYDVYDESIYDWLLAHGRTLGTPALRTASATGMQSGTPESAAPARPPPAPMAVTLTASPATIRFGQPATLAWTAAGAESCVASGDWFGKRPAQGAESFVPPAPGSYSYILTCSGQGSVAAQSVWLAVRPVDDFANQAKPAEPYLSTQPVRSGQ